MLTVKYHEGSGFHRAKSEKLGEGEREKGKIAEGPKNALKAVRGGDFFQTSLINATQ